MKEMNEWKKLWGLVMEYIQLQNEFKRTHTPIVGSVISPIHHEVDEGVTDIFQQSKTCRIVDGSRGMNHDQWPVVRQRDGQSKTSGWAVKKAVANAVMCVSVPCHAHQMHLGWSTGTTLKILLVCLSSLLYSVALQTPPQYGDLAVS